MTQVNKIQLPIWSLLASIKLTVAVLLMLAATSVIGTLIPQGGNLDDYITKYGEVLYRILYVFDLTDMYHSWWFRTLIGLLIANIAVCTIKRFPGVWKIVFYSKTEKPMVKAGQRHSFEFADYRQPKELKPLYEKYISKHFSHYWLEQNDNGFHIVGERGRWTRLGVTGVHLSILILLAGTLVGSIFGFDGSVNIAEGERIDKVRLRNSGEFIHLDFEVLCDDFNVSFYDSGVPKEYRSRLQVLENGEQVIQKDIIVNDPLRYKGINFFQSSYGNIPPKELKLSFTNRTSGTIISKTMSIGERENIPNTELKFYLQEIRNTYLLGGTDVGETVLGVLETPNGKPKEVILPLRFPSYDKMRKDEWIISVEDHKHMYYTGLQVTHDPGVPMVYAGFIILIMGCYVTFFMSHQKIAVEVLQTPGSSRVKVYGSTSRSSIVFDHQLQQITASLGGHK